MPIIFLLELYIKVFINVENGFQLIIQFKIFPTTLSFARQLARIFESLSM